MTVSDSRSARPFPWQLVVAALAVAGGVFSFTRDEADFNRYVVTLMWLGVAIFWVVLWRQDGRRRRRRAGPTGPAPTPRDSAVDDDAAR